VCGCQPSSTTSSPASDPVEQLDAGVGDAPAPIVGGAPIEVAEGVFVIPDRRVPLVPNVGIVVGEHAALVIDTGIGARNGRYVLAQANQLAGGRPLYLTTTHFHPEHSFGAQAFKGAATIMYNRSQREELHRKGAGFVDMFTNLGPQVAAELEGVELIDPDLTYVGRAEIDLGGRRAVLQEVGPAHSAADQTVLVDDRILFTGDLVETRFFLGVPYFPPFDTDVDGSHWISVLDGFLSLEPEVVVPGHGEIGDTTAIREGRDYLDHVRTQAAQLQASGASMEEAAATIEHDARTRWSNWENPMWIGLAARAFYQASSQPDQAHHN
jgi:glyoxylase-like metal-dependent hydrolase (beta-lactamase superfamily II)